MYIAILAVQISTAAEVEAWSHQRDFCSDMLHHLKENSSFWTKLFLVMRGYL
jgi:hypothetical protein